MAIVNFYAAAQAAVGTRQQKIPAGSIATLIADLSKSNEALAKLLPTCSFLLNGEAVSNLNQTLVEGDNVDILPQFAGG